MLKENKLLYYISLGFLIWALIKYYGEHKSYEKKEVSRSSENKEVIQLDIAKPVQSFKKITDRLNEKRYYKIVNGIKINESLATYGNLGGKTVGLCSNFYEMDVAVFSYEGEKIYQQTLLKLDDFKESEDIYTLLQRTLILTPEMANIEFFVPELSLMPSFMIKDTKNSNRAGLLKISNLRVVGGETFNINDVELIKSIYNKERSKRAGSKYFCEEVVNFKYNVYDAEGKSILNDMIIIEIGKGINYKERLFEYLILTSEEGDVEAKVPSSIFFTELDGRKPENQTLLLKGEIYNGK